MRLPPTIDSTASSATSDDQRSLSAPPARALSSRSRTIALAALGATDRKATNGEGAPW